MDTSEIAEILRQQILSEITLVLQEMSPPEAQGSWKVGRDGKIELDKIMNPEAQSVVELREEGGREMRMVEKIQPKIVSRRPKQVSGYRRRTSKGIQQVSSHQRGQAQPSLEEQLTPVQVEEAVYVQKNPFIHKAIETAIERVLGRTKFL